MRLLFLAALFLPIAALAQTTVTTRPANTIVAAPVVPVTPAAPPSPWKISYFVEWYGPALGNIDLRRTQVPGSPPYYSEIDHSFKLGYGVSKDVTIGTQIRGTTLLAPDAGFIFFDPRLYTQWSNMINTSDVGMSGKVSFQYPTSGYYRNQGNFLSIKMDFNFELKTALRNWSFSFDAMVHPYFFNDPVSDGGKIDLEFGIFPYVTLDLSPNVQLLFEGSFDGNHNYNSAFYDFASAYSDYIDIGPLFTVNSHINTNVALRFFMDDISFKQSAIYANIGVAL